MWVFQTTGAALACTAGYNENDNHNNPLASYTGFPPTRQPETLTFVTKWYFPVLQQHWVFTQHRSQDFDSVATSKIHYFVQSC